MCSEATNLFWLGDPKDNPELASVLKSMGFPVIKPILHAEHPVVLAFKAQFPRNPFVFTPRKASQKSSILVGADPVSKSLNKC